MKKKKIKFSVLMSVYYKEKPLQLDAAMESVFSQTLMPDEVILVEDGPLTSDLDETIKKYLDKYSEILKVIKLSQNRGLGNALNEGLKHCSYEYVARMDTDDISESKRFEKQIKYLSENNNIDVLGTNIVEYDDLMKNKLSKRTVPTNDEEIKKYAKSRNPMNHVSVIFKKQNVLKAGGYQDCLYFEDYFLWVRMIQNGNTFHNIQESLVNVRGGDEMIDRRGGIKYIKAIYNFEKKIKKLNFIDSKEFIYNIVARTTVAIIPKFLRKVIYEKKLRIEV